MHISAINVYCNTNYKKDNYQPNFQKLIVDNFALRVVKKMSKEDKVEFQNIKKRLSKTKYWDLSISAAGEKFKNFVFKFINKKDPKASINDTIYPYNLENDTIHIYTIDYKNGNNTQNIVEALKYENAEKAKQIYNDYLENNKISMNKHWILTPLENLISREKQLNMLEEAYKNMGRSERHNVLNTHCQTKDTVGSLH